MELYLSLSLMSYLIGSIPTGLLFSRLYGIDIRKEGSGNIGATNVARVMGKKMGLMTLFLDLSKGLLPIVIVRYYFWESKAINLELLISLMGFSAILGHCFPIFLRFNGGKGVATAAGAFLAICPLAAGFVFAIFMLTFHLSRIVSLSSITSSLMMPIAISIICPSKSFLYMSIVSSFVIIYRHKDNIRRLLRGEEKRFSLGKGKT